MSTAGLYDDLQAEDIPPQEAFPVPSDTPVEGPRQFEEPAMTPDVPGPDMQAQADEFVPPVPAEAPGNIGAPAPLPGAPPTAPLPAALDVNAPPAPTEGLSDDIAKRQKEQGIQEAKVKEANVNRQAETTQAADDDARLAYADYLERRKKAEDHYEQARQKFEGMNTLTDPREKMTGGEKFKAALYRFFSGLAGPEQTKIAMATLQKKWDDDIELQKARIGTLKDSMVMARSGLQDVDAGRAKLRAEADAFNEARYATAEKQGRAQLAHLGVSKAEIDGDERIQALQAAKLKARQQAQKDADAHALNKARIGWMEARASKARKAAKGGGGGGGGGASAQQEMADYAIKNPGDVGGLYAIAKKRGVPKADKVVTSIVNQTKGTESQEKSAKQSAVGMRAIDAIQKSGYTPSREEIQKWLNNQRLSYGAQQGGLKGLGLTIGQTLGAVPQSETEGLSDQAKEYFANTRRFMETIGRAQSGAAISPTEWENFFNQYGPNSKGGLEAAKQYMIDQARSAGVAARSLERPSEAGSVNAGPSAAAVAQAKAVINLPASDPRRTADRIAKAKAIISDATKPIKL